MSSDTTSGMISSTSSSTSTSTSTPAILRIGAPALYKLPIDQHENQIKVSQFANSSLQSDQRPSSYSPTQLVRRRPSNSSAGKTAQTAACALSSSSSGSALPAPPALSTISPYAFSTRSLSFYIESTSSLVSSSVPASTSLIARPIARTPANQITPFFNFSTDKSTPAPQPKNEADTHKRPRDDQSSSTEVDASKKQATRASEANDLAAKETAEQNELEEDLYYNDTQTQSPTPAELT